MYIDCLHLTRMQSHCLVQDSLHTSVLHTLTGHIKSHIMFLMLSHITSKIRNANIVLVPIQAILLNHCLLKLTHVSYSCNRNVATSKALNSIPTSPSFEITNSSPSSSNRLVFHTFLTSRLVLMTPLAFPPRLS